MLKLKHVLLAFITVVLLAPAKAQEVQIRKEQLIALTPLWTGERFPDA